MTYLIAKVEQADCKSLQIEGFSTECGQERHRTNTKDDGKMQPTQESPFISKQNLWLDANWESDTLLRRSLEERLGGHLDAID